MPGAPGEEAVKDAIAAVAKAEPNPIAAVIAHGSWVRGDFWPGQSDLDLIVIGAGAYTPSLDVGTKFAQLGATLGLVVEPWEVSEDFLRGLRTTRSGCSVIAESRIVQFDINGFDVIDNHKIVWGDPKRDPLQGFPVPRGQNLLAVACRRVIALTKEVGIYPEEMNRIACDALKAATIFLLLRAGQEPTRNKDVVFDRFIKLAPVFTGREVARAIWGLYRNGNKSGDPSHQASCKIFVDALATGVQTW